MTSTEKRVVTILGATGVQGGAITRHLSALGQFALRAVTRNPASDSSKSLAQLPNVTVYQGDMSHPTSLKDAFAGAEAVFVITNFYDLVDNSLEEARQGCAMADLAKEVGVGLFIWSSIPSALIRTGAKYASNPLVENKSVVTRYLEYRKIPHVVVYVGWYYDNVVNWKALTKTNDGSLEFTQPLLKADAPQGFSWVDKDLGPTIAAILSRYRETPEVLQHPVYSVARHDTLGNIMSEIKKQTGLEVRLNTPSTTGIKDLDELYGYENEYGVLTDVALPDPWTLSLGVEFHTMQEFITEVVVPYVKDL
ncbi:hypothetical protein G7Z17_g3880 [Cylindrodendrum hubeiense]|uniref:NmrA-like domain-containing protein n=1 Tax=Cylindrodendrum hubeiense TaxID=595255 RepID=A0A9P5LHR3_9HYPO|nr:hypothetical protein G7Z17_g3880 [Cylindrodendrum hubeiense]